MAFSEAERQQLRSAGVSTKVIHALEKALAKRGEGLEYVHTMSGASILDIHGVGPEGAAAIKHWSSLNKAGRSRKQW